MLDLGSLFSRFFGKVSPWSSPPKDRTREGSGNRAYALVSLYSQESITVRYYEFLLCLPYFYLYFAGLKINLKMTAHNINNLEVVWNKNEHKS